MRDKYRREIDSAGYSQSNIMGLLACESVYRDGARWLDELLEYLWVSICYVKDWLGELLPDVRLVEPEGTYFLWLDCRGLGLTDEQLDELLVHRARIWLVAGTVFGRGGEGFQRMNIACPRKVLTEGLERILNASKSPEMTRYY
jgi:cystathionine beta-lyase